MRIFIEQLPLACQLPSSKCNETSQANEIDVLATRIISTFKGDFRYRALVKSAQTGYYPLGKQFNGKIIKVSVQDPEFLKALPKTVLNKEFIKAVKANKIDVINALLNTGKILASSLLSSIHYLENLSSEDSKELKKKLKTILQEISYPENNHFPEHKRVFVIGVVSKKA